MHSSTFARCWISRSSEAPGSPVNGVRLRPEWIAFRRHCQKVHPSHWMTSLDHLANLRGEEDEEGNALPRRLATFCATLSILLHSVGLRRVMENGLDGERSTEPPMSGMIFPRHVLAMEKISASSMWRRSRALHRIVLWLRRNFLGHGSAYSFLPRIFGAKRSAGGFFRPHQIIFHSMCNNVWKNIWSPQNELGMEW